VIEALLLDLLMIVFTLLALGLSRAGQPAPAERVLILLCAAASSYMNVSAADVASPRVGRRVRGRAGRTGRGGGPGRGGDPPPRPGRPGTLRLDNRGPCRGGRGQDRRAGAVYCLRFVPAAPETARGLRRMVLDATPLPAFPEAPTPGTIEPSCTEKAVLFALYRAHPDYGDRGTASRVAAQLATQPGLQPGTARSYLYAELDGRRS
jgi:hypothetical protein